MKSMDKVDMALRGKYNRNNIACGRENYSDKIC